jgi:uncharacterized coiled-coil protein SlyX
MTKEELEVKNVELTERVAYLENQVSELEKTVSEQGKTADMYKDFWNSESKKCKDLEKKITTIKNVVDFVTL